MAPKDLEPFLFFNEQALPRNNGTGQRKKKTKEEKWKRGIIESEGTTAPFLGGGERRKEFGN